MAPGPGRSEVSLPFGLIYVKNQVLEPYEMLLAAVQAQITSGSSEGSESSRPRRSMLWYSRSSSLLQQWSQRETYSSQPRSACNDTPSPRRRGSGEHNKLEVAHIGGSDRYATLLWSLLSLRDAVVVHALVFGAGLGVRLVYGSLSGNVVSWPQNWSQVGAFLFGSVMLVNGVTGVAAALTRKLLLLHCIETFSSAIASALLVEGIVKLVAILVELFVMKRALSSSIILRIAEVVVVDWGTVVVEVLWFLGVIRSLRSVIVAGGRGTERLPWFVIIKSSKHGEQFLV